MSKPFVTTAFKKDGKFHVRNKPQFEKWTQMQRDGEFLVTFERAYATRSLEQNSLYWKAFVNPIAEHCGESARTMHEYLKARFLPTQKRQIKTLLLHDVNGVVIDEFELDLSTTTRLSKIEFSEYLSEIQVFAATLGVEVGSNREDDAA